MCTQLLYYTLTNDNMCNGEVTLKRRCYYLAASINDAIIKHFHAVFLPFYDDDVRKIKKNPTAW